MAPHLKKSSHNEKVYDCNVKTIKEIHAMLRGIFSGGVCWENMWSNHCKDNETLKKYANAMKNLGSAWDAKSTGLNRIEWCRQICQSYYFEGGLERKIAKDMRRMQHYMDNPSSFTCGPTPFSTTSEHLALRSVEALCQRFERVSGKLFLLDVGSCYNPFKNMIEFETVAIDLAPADEEVYRCDFLSVDVDASIEKCVFTTPSQPPIQCVDSCKTSAGALYTTEEERQHLAVTLMPACHFHVVVFSLLLTYIPCAAARWRLCERAHRVLRVDGLLLIVTPDSNHQNKRAWQMKDWQRSIEAIGFTRVHYSKSPHLHHLAFRKVPDNFVWDRRCPNAAGDPPRSLHIPQDFPGASTAPS